MNTWQFFMSAWSWKPAVVFAGLATLAIYAVVARLTFSKGIGFFIGALGVFFLTLASPIETLAEHYLFSAHMFQHMALLLIVPALALLARQPRRPRAVAAPRSLASRILTFPLTTWAAGVGAMWIWHAPALCDAATTSAAVRAFQTVTLLVLGGLFWWPVIGAAVSRRLPPLGGVVYLFTACLGCTLLGIIITFSPVGVCSIYMHPADPYNALGLIRNQWGFTHAVDQQVGGLMMWVPSCFIYLLGIMALLARWYSAPGEAVSAGSTPEPQPSPSRS